MNKEDALPVGTVEKATAYTLPELDREFLHDNPNTQDVVDYINHQMQAAYAAGQAEVEALTAERDAYKLQYGDLVFQVSRKFKDETRHQTAKRYIVSWEGRTVDQAIAKEAK